MTTKDSREYSLFTGCLIPSKFPFIEKASRLVLEKLGIKLHNIEGASCCPNQMAIQSSDKQLWYTIAARNLALAEKNGCNILSLCNGCYDTLKTVNTKLKGDEKFRDEINSRLADVGLEYHGEIEVKHIIQVLHDDIGMNAIEKNSVNTFDNYKFAPFVGCHVKRPMDHMGFDDPEKPYYLVDLIRSTGAKTAQYIEEHSCCGGGLAVGRELDAVPYARRVLRSAEDAGGAAVVVNCPYCFAQLFRNERMIDDFYSEKMTIPIFYITQLLGLALGFKPEELGLPKHFKLSIGREEELVKSILEPAAVADVYNHEISRDQLEICRGCLACTDDCSTAMATSEYNPEEILELVLSGRTDEAVRRKDIWYCMNCHECIQHCPQDFGMVKLIVRLKNLAYAEGLQPEVVNHRREEMKKSGLSFPPDTECRAELGLCECTPPTMNEFRKLIDDITTDNLNE